MFAYVYASGLLELGPKVPDGALALASGPEDKLKDYLEGVCRHGYETCQVNGRPAKVQGSDCLLVPGIPEALSQGDGYAAFVKFRNWIKKGAEKAGLTIAALLVAAVVMAPHDASARGYHFHGFGFTSFPSHWLLDRGPRIIHSDGVDMGTYDGPAVVISRDYDDRPAAEAEALVQQRACLPVKVYMDDGLHVFPAQGCSRGR
jgi:hypothetical protein